MTISPEATERLLKSRRKYDDERRSFGLERGLAWVSEDAEWEEVLRVAQLSDDASVNDFLNALTDFGYDDDVVCKLFDVTSIGQISAADVSGFIASVCEAKERVEAVNKRANKLIERGLKEIDAQAQAISETEKIIRDIDRMTAAHGNLSIGPSGEGA
jgi:hypothetical protein